MDKLEKVLPAVMGGFLGITIAMAVAQYAVAAQTPYECPICGSRFSNYQDLYQHFQAEHPAEPIEIWWSD